MRIRLALFLCLLASPVFAQATGNSFPTPNGQTANGAVILVPTGPITNGQPVMGPPGPQNGMYVICTNCSPSAPTGASSNTVSGTISLTNTFQSLLAQNGNRKACQFQNQGTHTMYFSVLASPTLVGSFQIAAGGYFYCSPPGSNIVITDAIQVTGTAGDAVAGTWQ